MAKRKSVLRQQYDRNRKRIINFIRRAESRGFYFEEDVLPPIPKRITKQSVQRLEKLNPEALYKKSFWVDLETGETMSGPRRAEQERSERTRRGHETRRANRAAEEAFFTRGSNETIAGADNEPSEDDYLPDLYEIAFDNVFDEFLAKVSQDIPEVYYSHQTGKKHKRFERIRIAAQEAQSEVIKILNELLSKYTKSQIGKVISEHWEQLEAAVQYILYGSDEAAISSSATLIMSVLTGGLTKEQNMALTGEAEMQEDYGEGYM